MASDTITGLREEVAGALATHEPQVRGLEDLAKVSLSASSRDFISLELERHRRRVALLHNLDAALNQVGSALASLTADGYPAMEKGSAPAAVFQELQEEKADLAAAMAEFVQEAPASTLKVALGAASPK